MAKPYIWDTLAGLTRKALIFADVYFSGHYFRGECCICGKGGELGKLVEALAGVSGYFVS